MAMTQQANAPLIITIGAVSGLLLLVLMFGVEAWFRYEERAEYQDQWDNSKNEWLDTLREGQAKHLNAYAYNAKAKSWTIPIAQAMEKVVATDGKVNVAPPATQPAGK
jgi:hypothetical protein